MEDIFEKALRLLYERRLAMEGLQADIIVTKEEPDETEPSRVPA